MKTLILSLFVAMLAATAPSAARAECYVEYKAKQDSPLRLHYGILSIPGTCPGAAQARQITADRVSAGGWTLLNVLGLSTNPPSEKQVANAGVYYLRF